MVYANSVDPDQTAPLGAVWSGSTLFSFPLNISRNNCIKANLALKKVWNKAFEILGHLLYSIFNIRTTPLIRPLSDSPKSRLNSGMSLYLNIRMITLRCMPVSHSVVSTLLERRCLNIMCFQDTFTLMEINGYNGTWHLMQRCINIDIRSWRRISVVSTLRAAGVTLNCLSSVKPNDDSVLSICFRLS